MRTTEAVPGGLGLETLQRQIEDWRRSPAKGKEMPAELWDAATAASEQFGTSRVARALGVNYQRLKAQIDQRSGTDKSLPARKRRAVRGAAVQFVDLGKIGGPAPPISPDELVVDLVATDGMRVTIRTRQATAAVLEVISAIRGRGRS
jgi:hypothetical protein